MRNRISLAWVACLAGAMVFAPDDARALIEVGHGNEPVRDAGWAEGALAVANLPSRIGWWVGPPLGGGEWHFLYAGDTAAFNLALTAFAAIQGPALELVVHDYPGDVIGQRKETNGRLDWSFTVWEPRSWTQMHRGQPIAPPRLDLHLDEGSRIDWAKIEVPPNVKVQDERTSAAGLAPELGSVVRVDVEDVAAGKPVTGARVFAARVVRDGASRNRSYEPVAEALSDGSGRAQIEKIPAGSYWILVQAGEYASLEVAYARFGAHTFRQYRAALAKAATLKGIVTDTEGKPLEGIRVYPTSLKALDGQRYGYPEVETVTDRAGKFEFTGLPVGSAQLSATSPDHCRGSLNVAVPTNNVVLQMSRAGKLHVTVVDREGKPMSRYENKKLIVEVEDKGGARVGAWGGSATVKDDGTFEFSNVTPGEYRVTSHPNPSTVNKKYSEELLIKIAPGEKVSVKIKYPDYPKYPGVM